MDGVHIFGLVLCLPNLVLFPLNGWNTSSGCNYLMFVTFQWLYWFWWPLCLNLLNFINMLKCLTQLKGKNGIKDSAYWIIWSNFLKWLKCLKSPHMGDTFQFNDMFIMVDIIRMAIIPNLNLLFCLTILTSLKGLAGWPWWLTQIFDVVTLIW